MDHYIFVKSSQELLWLAWLYHMLNNVSICAANTRSTGLCYSWKRLSALGFILNLYLKYWDTLTSHGNLQNYRLGFLWGGKRWRGERPKERPGKWTVIPMVTSFNLCGVIQQDTIERSLHNRSILAKRENMTWVKKFQERRHNLKTVIFYTLKSPSDVSNSFDVFHHQILELCLV